MFYIFLKYFLGLKKYQNLAKYFPKRLTLKKILAVQSTNIKNIIFDLGNVLIDLDLAKTDSELERVLGSRFRRGLSENGAELVFEQFEMGLLSEDSFVDILRSCSHSAASRTTIIDAWNAMLLGFQTQRFEMLKNLQQAGYQLFVLSNTNTTHLEWVYQHLEKAHGIMDFDQQFFTKTYYSHLLRLRKPNTNIYEFVLQDASISPSETLFIDDNADNIFGAKAVGLQTVLHPIGVEISTTIQQYLLHSEQEKAP